MLHSYSKYHASAWQILDPLNIRCSKQAKVTVDISLTSSKGDHVSKRRNRNASVTKAKGNLSQEKSGRKSREGLQLWAVQVRKASQGRCHLSGSLQEVGSESSHLEKSVGAFAA